MLIIGILAAIALPTFAGQGRRGQDANAKSNARNLVGEVEACSAEKTDYTQCDSLAELSAGGDQLGFVYGGAPGQAEVSSAKTEQLRRHRTLHQRQQLHHLARQQRHRHAHLHHRRRRRLPASPAPGSGAVRRRPARR